MENKSWNDHTDTFPIQDDEEMKYNDLADIEHMGYTNKDIHDEQLRQPIGNIYQPPQDQDHQLEGDYHTHETGRAPSSPNNDEYKRALQMTSFSVTDNINDRIGAAQMCHPWLHPTTIAKALQIYKNRLSMPKELQRFQEKLC